jgi:hypothetical protein
VPCIVRLPHRQQSNTVAINAPTEQCAATYQQFQQLCREHQFERQPCDQQHQSDLQQFIGQFIDQFIGRFARRGQRLRRSIDRQ